MASQQHNDPGNAPASKPPEPMPEVLTGSDFVPRARSSTFGIPQGDGDAQNTNLPNSPSPIIQQERPKSIQSTPSQATQTRPATRSESSSSLSYHHSTAGGRLSIPTRSPFSPPIACPARTRPNQVLLINPTCTSILSNVLLSTLRPILPNALEVTAYTAPYPAPTAIESVVDSVLSSETVLRDLAKYSTNNGETVQNFDGFLLASYCKHPLIDALRESYDVPVIGVLEASLYVARMIGGRFGILTTSTRMKFQIDDAIAAYGLARYCVGIESIHVNPLDLIGPEASTGIGAEDRSSQHHTSASTRSQTDLQKKLAVQARTLLTKGADTIVLGSEFLTNSEIIRLVKDAVRDQDGRRTVNVIDAVEAGIMMLNGLVGMGIPTSKRGIFRGEGEGRRGRGQNWL